jgi:hypothetical protein
MNTCIFCKKEFVGREERPNKFCSHECHVSSSKIGSKIQVELTCKSCGKNFVGYEDRQFCSLKCVHASMRMPEKPCAGCGKMFAPEKVKTVYCNKECEVKSRRNAEEPPPISGARWVHLTKGKFALVDEDDFDRVSEHSWCVTEGKKTSYAKTYLRQNNGRQSSKLHHYILSVTDVKIRIDHINMNGLDCRRSNLRVTDGSKNMANTLAHSKSGYKGVATTRGGKFVATIRMDHQGYHLGVFDVAEDAARAYDAKARELHGSNGRFNFPLNGEMSASYCCVEM